MATSRLAIGCDKVWPVDHNGNAGALGGGKGHGIDLDLAGQRRAQEQVFHPGFKQCEEFARLGAADPKRAGCYLTLGDFGTFMRFGMRSNIQASLPASLSEKFDVLLEHAEIEHRRRSSRGDGGRPAARSKTG